MHFTLAQQKALAIAPKVTAPLSMIGSYFIMKGVLSDKTKMKSSYHRILFAMSFVDFCASFWYGLSTWPIPKETLGVWNPVGTSSTCQAQGFFIQTSAWIPALNASLALYYLMDFRFNWTEQKIRRIEPLLIGVPLFMGYGTALAAIPLKLYNNANLWCWMAPFPLNCKDSYRHKQAANCIRGDNAWIYRWAFGYGPIWASILVATVAMMLVYCSVLRKEKEVDKFQENGLAVRKQSVRIAWQGLWYVLAFYATWVPPTLVRLLQTIPATSGKVFFPLILIMAIFVPLQGFFNFIVYSRGRYCKYKRENPQATRWEAIKIASFSTYPSSSALVSNACPEQDCFTITTQTQSRVATEAILQSEVAWER